MRTSVANDRERRPSAVALTVSCSLEPRRMTFEARLDTADFHMTTIECDAGERNTVLHSV